MNAKTKLIAGLSLVTLAACGSPSVDTQRAVALQSLDNSRLLSELGCDSGMTSRALCRFAICSAGKVFVVATVPSSGDVRVDSYPLDGTNCGATKAVAENNYRQD